MERNIGDRLNKAYEAYRQASIEKDSAEKELQQKTEYYQRYTQQLEQQIEDQQQLISKLKAQLSSAAKVASGELNCRDPFLQKQEVENFPANKCHPDDTSYTHQLFLRSESMGSAEIPACTLPGTSTENNDILGMFWDLQGKFHLIQALTRKQTDHLRKSCRGNGAASEQNFSMPIQCTDVTAQQAEGPFSSVVRAALEAERPSSPLTPRGTGSAEDDNGSANSLTHLSVRLPPGPDSTYEFLNSTAEKGVDAAKRGEERVTPAPVPAGTEERSLELGGPLLHPLSVLHPASPVCEAVRGPQQPLWNPVLCEAAAQAGSPDPQQSPHPGSCAFCNALVPLDHIYGHLNSHCQGQTRSGR
ncbi:TRAF family member-associated NF-kappa-B activator-like [Megalops cyprinoides]|uniref:TRAF family member-associated NF-kappa-B activator-like n=1 Tax=Megalops cyprinoides TaxID=118141 RepID=UPI001863E52F|nr:TRAF family member-associated NF-kappa-B activator-like [Megalops cyprinoides]